MTSDTARFPGIRVAVVFAFALWLMALALPECHLPTLRTDGPHPHVESFDPTVPSTYLPGIDVDPHEHIAGPGGHLAGDLVLAALPREQQQFGLLLLATALLFALPSAARIGPGVRAPPCALLSVRSGRDLLTRIGIARN